MTTAGGGMSELAGWNNFYVIVGSSAGALIGLQFVVMTLIGEMGSSRVDTQASDAFATPSVVHFSVTLLLSAIMSAPWQAITIVGFLWGLVGLGGVVYCFVVARRMRLQDAYKPVFEDWLFHILFPFTGYAMFAVSAFVAQSHLHTALYSVGASTLVFLFIGIHNSWDAVTYHLFARGRERRGSDKVANR